MSAKVLAGGKAEWSAGWGSAWTCVLSIRKPRGVTAIHSRDIKEKDWVRALRELEEVGEIAGEITQPPI